MSVWFLNTAIVDEESIENYIANRLQDVSKKISSTIIPGDALLLQVASKRAVFLRSFWETGCSILLISFYLIYEMAIGSLDTRFEAEETGPQQFVTLLGTLSGRTCGNMQIRKAEPACAGSSHEGGDQEQL